MKPYHAQPVEPVRAEAGAEAERGAARAHQQITDADV